jgi:phosphotransferase system HPr (HPr) family protein
MKEITFIIRNPVWMHPGTAVSFTFRMEKFSSRITVSRGGESRNGKEFYELMKLRNVKGEKTTFKADGPDEEEAIDSITEFVNDNRELS